ncbi:ATP-binding protein [Micromonospora craterilacus]|uniref:ATP-binding protein n=1 Tax=Micromonospora craterilacus TaxID=1655439 RepID=A0A2W2EZE9_9ACTN|nr:ATP-binding protein [Micromonospora craterilacus]PZG22299.1 ATP-binding protein [Micromonospora craterilacus]
MLLSFRFANHRSFRYEQQLNLMKVYDRKNPENLQNDAVRVIGIFGANASGKSNCLQALSYMRRMVTSSDREVEPGLGLVRDPFRLDAACLAEPSRYIVDLTLKNVRYTYGFTLDNERILEEWLYYYPLNRRRRVFERDGDDFVWGEESGKKPDLERIAEITAPTALFMSTVARFSRRRTESDTPDAEPLHSVYRWFFRTRTRSRPGPRLSRHLSMAFPEFEDDRLVIVDLLRAADIGIVDVTLKSPTPIQPPLFADLSDQDLPSETAASTGVPRRLTREAAARSERRIQFAHRGASGKVMLELADESSGTQQLLDLAIDASVVLRLGGTMTVDEIDASLHPLLTAKLIALFQSEKTNPRGSQLIFTSHDAALLGTFDTEEVLRRDEIWFVEKDEEGSSVVYPLTDFKPRKEGENRQRRYLNGNYGGVPDLSFALFERALAGRGDTE